MGIDTRRVPTKEQCWDEFWKVAARAHADACRRAFDLAIDIRGGKARGALPPGPAWSVAVTYRADLTETAMKSTGPYPEDAVLTRVYRRTDGKTEFLVGVVAVDAEQAEQVGARAAGIYARQVGVKVPHVGVEARPWEQAFTSPPPR